MTLKRVIFIRSGETDWNRLGRQQGWVASPLNHLGYRQIERLAKYIRNIGISAVYSSDLKRAVQTAELVAERLGYPVIYDARLRERHIGHWQGMTLDEVRTWYADEYAALLADVEGYQIPGGEARSEVKVRMLAAFGDIVVQAPGETVGIISHTTNTRALLEALVPSQVDTTTMQLTNSSVTTIRRTDSAWEIVAADDVQHLEGLETHSVQEPEDKTS
jgi:broad specificity phosphatase PhoE